MGCTCENSKSEANIELQKPPEELSQKLINSTITIQSHIRGYLLRKKLYDNYIELMQNLHPSKKILPKNKNFLENGKENPENINSSNKEDEITEQDMSYLFSNYPPLKDGIKVILKPLQFDEDGACYSGEWDEEGNKHGRGIQLWPDGSKYYGYWIKNKVNKRGKLVHIEGDVYEGEWVDFKAEGFGIYTTLNGTKYEGDWVADNQEGKGREEWPDGNIYIGDYLGGTKHGKGKFMWNDGSIYEGQFNNNNIEGKGIYIWPDKREYNGDWKNNQMDGQGEFKWPDGRIYKGEYKKDQKDGFGIFIWPNGQKYKGYWKNGKQNGEGEIYSPEDNKWTKCTWENGELVS